MKSIRLLPLAVAAASFAVSAHAAGPLPAVTDPNAPVAPLQYQSILPDKAGADNNLPSPDKIWVQANRELAGGATTDPHAGHHPAAIPTTSAPTVPPQQRPPEAKPAAGAHQGHHMPTKEH